jgi:hypothetical protein
MLLVFLVFCVVLFCFFWGVGGVYVAHLFSFLWYGFLILFGRDLCCSTC